MLGTTTGLVKELEAIVRELTYDGDANNIDGCVRQLRAIIERVKTDGGRDPLPVGKIVNWQLCCPRGHHDDLVWVEDTTLSREINGFYPDKDGDGRYLSKDGKGGGGELKIDGYYDTDDEGGEGHLFCSAQYQFRGKTKSCDTWFELPPGVNYDFI